MDGELNPRKKKAKKMGPGTWCLATADPPRFRLTDSEVMRV